MDLKQLKSIRLTAEDVESLLDLPPPETLELSGSEKNLVDALDNLMNLWSEILVDGRQIPLEAYEYTCPHGHVTRHEGFDLRGRLLLSVSGYFDHLARRYLALPPDKSRNRFPASISTKTIGAFLADAAAPQFEHDPRRIRLRILTVEYLLALLSLTFLQMFRQTAALRMAISQFEEQAHKSLVSLFSSSSTIRDRNDAAAANRLLGGALRLAQLIYDDSPTMNVDHKLGPFSAIRLEELALLARRDESLFSRYGKNRIARRFEQQLALIFQSLGLYVVSTRVGTSTVDLVCISSDSDERVTFLVEAKTSKAAYSLPKKDARALREYVSDVRHSLSTLPPLGFVLILGGEPSRTLSDKLAELESQLNAPVRFLRSQQLADLRERIPGQLPLRVFCKEVLVGDRILGEEFVTTVATSYQNSQDAHKSFVETMLSAKGAVPIQLGWAPDDHAA